jgi:hypothetical protein
LPNLGQTGTGHYNYTARVAFSPDGRRLAAIDWQAAVTIWDSNQAADSDSPAPPPPASTLVVQRAPPPQDREALIAQANFCVSTRQWQKALMYQTLVAKAHPTDHWLAFRLATLLLAADDTAGYREHRRRMLDRWGHATEWQQAERTAKICSLIDLGDQEGALVLELAQRAVRETEARSAGANVVGWCKFAEGLALYRCHRPAEAIPCMVVVAKTPGMFLNFIQAAHFLRAMSLYHLKRPAEARAALGEGLAIASPEVGTPEFMNAWHDWLICRFLQSEAEALLTPKK